MRTQWKKMNVLYYDSPLQTSIILSALQLQWRTAKELTERRGSSGGEEAL